MIKTIHFRWQNDAQRNIDGADIDAALDAIADGGEPGRTCNECHIPGVARTWFTDGELFVCFEWHDPDWIEIEDLSWEDWPDVNDLVSCATCGMRGWTEMYGDVLPAGFREQRLIWGEYPNRHSKSMTFCSEECLDKMRGLRR
jgi:hypothetical protein